MLAGIIAFARMQVNNAPDIDFPAAVVEVTQPGAAPNELETQVTQRVEFGNPGRQRRRGDEQHRLGGNSETLVQFQLGTPPTARSTTSATPFRRSAAPFPRAFSTRR